ncbi:helix-turn-helix domain-containing protein [Microbulbifer flavimaris]|uniref:Helix-turn-helix domain-containing protein n=1 Tax=Microbulbifer flavimaris TaxID=1781068 RepID=A0ABX4HWL6_9GAMM|nr:MULTISPECIES: RodZ domain-containing protein [Microbulbifer]KUJ81497.1 hypothetical protein AVO43_13125 [Microbulbifer sp. ZGT114]PCO04406.1 helix-turn-helix domain-containing protein [Microbulbifer flavimaris]
MTDKVVENAQASTQSAELREEHPSPGTQLRTAREAAGLSLEELSSRLRMTGNKLELLERDEYDRLPSALYVRGYIRNACKELGVDAEPVLEAFSGYSAAEEESRAIIEHVSRGPALEPGRKGGFGLLALLPLVLVAAAFWWFQGRDLATPSMNMEALADDQAVQQGEQVGDLQGFTEQAAEPIAAEPLQAEEVGAAGEAVAVAASEPELSDTAIESPSAAALEVADVAAYEALSAQAGTSLQAVESEAPVAADDAVAEIGVEVTEVAEPETPAASAVEAAADPAPAAATAPSAAPVAEAASEALELRFSQEAWIEVKDASGKVLLAKLQAQGSQVTLEGQPPFSLMLGNAAGTEVRYRDQLVPSEPIGSRRTRRLTVGE